MKILSAATVAPAKAAAPLSDAPRRTIMQDRTELLRQNQPKTTGEKVFTELARQQGTAPPDGGLHCAVPSPSQGT